MPAAEGGQEGQKQREEGQRGVCQRAEGRRGQREGGERTAQGGGAGQGPPPGCGSMENSYESNWRQRYIRPRFLGETRVSQLSGLRFSEAREGCHGAASAGASEMSRDCGYAHSGGNTQSQQLWDPGAGDALGHCTVPRGLRTYSAQWTESPRMSMFRIIFPLALLHTRTFATAEKVPSSFFPGLGDLVLIQKVPRPQGTNQSCSNTQSNTTPLARHSFPDLRGSEGTT